MMLYGLYQNIWEVAAGLYYGQSYGYAGIGFIYTMHY